jgi:crotonobetainyl-CoA:carnitine CoA-transferase CaiB-like acyl-CoA transferase
MLVDAPDDDLGTITLAAPVPRLSRTPGRVVKSGGRIGQHTREVLAELAGLSARDLDELEALKVIASDGAPHRRTSLPPGERQG